MDKRKDRRIRKTQKQLRAGLAKLMKQKCIMEITVKELVDEVDINRSTFYLHYTDIYDMLVRIEGELMDEIIAVIESHPNVVIGKDEYSYIEDIFKILEENKDICVALLGEYGDLAFVHRMEKLIAEHSIRFFQSQHPEMAEELSFAYAFCLSGCVGLLKDWLNGEMLKTPQEMAAITGRMIEGVRKSVSMQGQEGQKTV